MKKKLTIALAAILAITLIAAGCTAAAAPLNDGNALYGGGNASVNAIEPGAAYNSDSDTDTVGSGYGRGNGGGGYGLETGNYDTETDACYPVANGTAGDPDYALTEQDQALSLAGYGSEGALDDEIGRASCRERV